RSIRRFPATATATPSSSSRRPRWRTTAPTERHRAERPTAIGRSLESERPDQQDGGDGYRDHHHLERQPHPPVVSEAVAAGAEDEGVVLVADGGQEGAGGGD